MAYAAQNKEREGSVTHDITFILASPCVVMRTPRSRIFPARGSTVCADSALRTFRRLDLSRRRASATTRTIVSIPRGRWLARGVLT